MLRIEDQYNLLPLRETEAYQKKARIAEKILESQTMEKERIEREIVEKEEAISLQNSILAENFANHNKLASRKAKQEALEKNYNNMEKLLIESVSDIIYESLLIDLDVKEANKDNIYTKTNNFFKESFDKNLFTLKDFENCESVAIKEIYRECLAITERLAESYEHEVEDILKEAKEERAVRVNRIAEGIKTKVTKVIKKEKEIAEKEKEMLEEAVEMGHIVRKEEQPSLFKSIMIHNDREHDNGKYIIENVENKMDSILVESIIEYTLLECLFTTRLINPTASQVQSLAFKYRFNKPE